MGVAPDSTAGSSDVGGSGVSAAAFSLSAAFASFRSSRSRSRRAHVSSYSFRASSPTATPSKRTGLRTWRPSRTYHVYSRFCRYTGIRVGPSTSNCSLSSRTYCSSVWRLTSRRFRTFSMNASSSLVIGGGGAGEGFAGACCAAISADSPKVQSSPNATIAGDGERVTNASGGLAGIECRRIRPGSGSRSC